MSSLPDELPRYSPDQTYRWNYDHAPREAPVARAAAVPGRWTFCGHAVPSPLGIAAGPLLNGAWVLYYAALGFDVLTYKTVRTRARDCFPLPNLQPVRIETMTGSERELTAIDRMSGSWAISFGMPSSTPQFWRQDLENTRKRLDSEKKLSVSVVASPESEWTLEDLAEDYATCASWAVESGADAVEANFSCPNVATCDGQIYQHPHQAAVIAQRLRERIKSIPLILKIGYCQEAELIDELVEIVGPVVDAFSMTNCLPARIRRADGELMFSAEPRGIGGHAIRSESVRQVLRFAHAIAQRSLAVTLIGVGGISSAQDVRLYLDAGAESVQLATAAMLDPRVGLRIREELAANS